MIVMEPVKGGNLVNLPENARAVLEELHGGSPASYAIRFAKQIYHDWNADYYYNVVHTGGGKAKASECIKCGKCEKACPQHLHIRDLLADVANEFEKH